MPRLLAILATSVGSMPRMRWPPFWKFEISVPSLEPISIDQIVLGQAEHLRRLGVEARRNCRAGAGHAAGVGIFRREDDDRIDGEAELHQFAIRAVQQVGRKPRSVASAPRRSPPSGSPAACSRARARSPAAHGRRSGSIRPERFRRCRRHAQFLLGTQQFLLRVERLIRSIRLLAQAFRWPNTSRRSAARPCASGTLRLVARAFRASRCPGSAARCRRPAPGFSINSISRPPCAATRAARSAMVISSVVPT